VSASVFDAVNGIDPNFNPLLVTPNAPHNASQRAAAIQAAYAMLLHLYPTQNAALTSRRDASLTALASTEKAGSIAAGAAWGQTVADTIWTARLTDGFAPPPPPFIGVQGIVGTPAVGFGAPRRRQRLRRNATNRHHDAWVLRRPSQFPFAGAASPQQQEYATISTK